MVYPWECEDCKHVTDAERRLADMDTPPDACAACGKTALKRIVVRPKGVQGYILNGPDWHYNSYHKNGPIK